jgi:signal transduction histidine kinase
VVIAGQADLVDIAVRNVVDNALKASPQDSTVAVTVSRDGTVTVEDHGPGIPDGRLGPDEPRDRQNG